VTPYDVVAQTAPSRRGTKPELVALCRRFETEALVTRPERVFATLQDARYVTAATLSAYRRLADGGAQVRLFARGLQAWLGPGVAGVDLLEDDPLVDEWCVVLGSERTPTAFAATDLRVLGAPETERAFVWAVSHDPDVVQECTRLLSTSPA